MSTTHPPAVADVLASIRRIVGEGASPPVGDGKRVTIGMTAMDSTQRAVADAARVAQERREALDGLEGMADTAHAMRNEHYRTAHRDAPTVHTGKLAPMAAGSGDPALRAQQLAHAASYAAVEEDHQAQAQAAAESMRKATAEHDAALAARDAYLRNAHKGSRR